MQRSRHANVVRAAVLTAVVPFVSAAILATPAQARAPRIPPYAGPATGAVSCDVLNVKVSFAPPLTLADTGPTTVTMKGTLKGCTTDNSLDVISLGKISATFTVSGGCSGLAAGTTDLVTMTVKWKGKHGGAKTTYTDSTASLAGIGPAIDPVTGLVGFEFPNVDAPSNSVWGSFAGPVADSSAVYGTQDSNQIGALCAPRPGPHGTQKPAKGLKKLTVKSGEVSLP